MSTSTNPETPSSGDTVENAIELQDVVGLSQGQIVRRRFFRHKGALVGLAALGGTILLAVTSVGLGPIPGWWMWTGYETGNPMSNPGGSPTLSLFPPALGDHPFGQDELGRDIFARVMEGVQTSLMVMFVIGLVAGVIGVLVGSVAGFYRGGRDTALMRFTDLVITVPTIVIGAVIGKLSGQISAPIFAISLGLILWTTLSRLVRGEFLALREREFVDAARVAGASSGRIIFKHILPNAIGTIIVSTTLLMSSAILLETALSYLGFGVQAPDTSLGRLVSDGQTAAQTRPWLFYFPGLFIIVIVLCVNFVGDGLRDAFDPKQTRVRA